MTFEQTLNSLSHIHETSKYSDQQKTNFPISFHAFNLLKMMRTKCICAETSRDIITDKIAPMFKNDMPSEQTDQKMITEIKKQFATLRKDGLIQ